jgi:hypothetical protein
MCEDPGGFFDERKNPKVARVATINRLIASHRQAMLLQELQKPVPAMRESLPSIANVEQLPRLT